MVFFITFLLASKSTDLNVKESRFIGFIKPFYPLFFRFFAQVNQHLRNLGRSQESWDEFVDMVASAYLANQRLPPTDHSLNWECLFGRIQQGLQNSPALMQRVVACLQLMNSGFRSSLTTPAAVGPSIPPGGAPPQPPPPPLPRQPLL